MNSIQKESHTLELMTSSSPGYLAGSAKGINTQESETSGKSATKLPPLTKNKIEESFDIK